MKNILEYLEESSNKFPNKVALKDEFEKYTFEEFKMLSQRIGSEITKYSQPRMPIPVLLDKSIKALTTFMGIVYAGDFYVYLNSELPIDRLKSILKTLDSEIIITDESNKDLAKDININNSEILMYENLIKSNIDETSLRRIREQALDVDPLYANFTSGSTGVPKGVLVGHRSVIDFINVFTNKFEITSDDIIANQAPFDFDVSVKDIYSCLKTGATLVVIPKKLFSLPAKLLDYMCDNNVTTMIWAVSALCLITTFHGLDYKTPSTVNKVMFSGEIMPLKHLKQWIEHLPNATFVNLYGPTEITCNCTYCIIDKELKYEKQIPMGIPFDNEQVFLLNEKSEKITTINENGEIIVKGSALALGYFNNVEQTTKSFVQNPLHNKYIDMVYKTGDLGYYGEDGNLYFAGRKDFQIKHMGHRIELEEIERTIEKIDKIERVCCLYREEKKKIYAFYVGQIDKEELHTKLKETLPVFMIPNVFKQIEEFPITKNGKLDRSKLKEMM